MLICLLFALCVEISIGLRWLIEVVLCIIFFFGADLLAVGDLCWLIAETLFVVLVNYFVSYTFFL